MSELQVNPSSIAANSQQTHLKIQPTLIAEKREVVQNLGLCLLGQNLGIVGGAAIAVVIGSVTYLVAQDFQVPRWASLVAAIAVAPLFGYPIYKKGTWVSEVLCREITQVRFRQMRHLGEIESIEHQPTARVWEGRRNGFQARLEVMQPNPHRPPTTDALFGQLRKVIDDIEGMGEHFTALQQVVAADRTLQTPQVRIALWRLSETGKSYLDVAETMVTYRENWNQNANYPSRASCSNYANEALKLAAMHKARFNTLSGVIQGLEVNVTPRNQWNINDVIQAPPIDRLISFWPSA